MKLEKFKIKNYKKLVITVFAFLIGIVTGYIIFYQSYAYYEENKNFDVINGTVEDPGDVYFAYYIDGEISREMPAQNTGYTLDSDKSNCNNNATVTWDNATWEAKVNYRNYSATTNTRTKCTLYFNKTSKTVSTVLGNIEVNNYIPDFTKAACDDEACESHEKGIYETTDYDGNPTYYYRGAVTNNYVKFAGYYWRIIRINSNGSIRMIYDGTVAHANGDSSDDRRYSTAKFNNNDNDNMYAGYMYTANQVNGLTTSSNIKNLNDTFFTQKLSQYSSFFDNDAVFCGNRTILNNQSGVGTARIPTYYRGYLNVLEGTPSLACQNVNDLYTTTSSKVGNKALTYPIGLITADEAMYAGYSGSVFDGTYNHQKSLPDNYLNINQDYWTMTPAGFYNPYVSENLFMSVFIIYYLGGIDDVHLVNNYGLRPVINIKSNVTITGSGTMTDPYVVS